jgi:hypothetical protein
MVSFLKRSSVPFLVGFVMLASTVPEVHGQSRARPSNRTTIGRTRPFIPSRVSGFDPFLRDRRGFDPFLRREFAFDPFLRREFAFDPFLRRRFRFDPFLGIGVFGFPASNLPPFFFAGGF